MCGFRRSAAALSVLAAARRLTARLPMLPVNLSLRGEVQQTSIRKIPSILHADTTLAIWINCNEYQVAENKGLITLVSDIAATKYEYEERSSEIILIKCQ